MVADQMAFRTPEPGDGDVGNLPAQDRNRDEQARVRGQVRKELAAPRLSASGWGLGAVGGARLPQKAGDFGKNGATGNGCSTGGATHDKQN